ncbi:hypothetical protein CXB36_01425 [Pseudomonas syringae pv. syringae]|nr:hypothetical protein BKC06_003575 [Pseudomonas syringae pv. syringae]POP69295.1 hypothetical protein CXB36_01425 [Pseudomonas syringae pv. syringae]
MGTIVDSAIVPHAPRGNAFRDALRRKRTRSVRNCMPTRSGGTMLVERATPTAPVRPPLRSC